MIDYEKLIHELIEQHAKLPKSEDDFGEGYDTAFDDIIHYLRWSEWP